MPVSRRLPLIFTHKNCTRPDYISALDIAKPCKFLLQQFELRARHPVKQRANLVDLRGLLRLGDATSKSGRERH
jgi:hypothetical protein